VHLYEIPLWYILAGLALYMVLGGADFGAGLWQLIGARGERGDRIRDHAHHSLAPVWEANHVWLIFVLTVAWTAYPVAFGSIASTLSVPLFIAAVGIICRGAAYAMRTGAAAPRETRRTDLVFATSSILTPFALGAAVGGIASRRIPVGNAAGDLFSSWLNPVSVLVGCLAVATSAYLAAVYLAGDARRRGAVDIEDAFRARALGAGLVAGALALAGLIVVRSDARPLYHGLVHGAGLGALAASIAAGLVTLSLVAQRRYAPARFSAAVAVAAIVVGWALAQRPTLLPGLTVRAAAAPHDTLVAIVVAVLAGSVILFPSLALLFGLVLGGRFDAEPAEATPPPAPDPPRRAAAAAGVLMRSSIAALVVGFGLLNVADAAWAHAVGVTALLAFVALGVMALLLPELIRTQTGR
jgi:cytochrome bd ubiquinol oxidase subunit II